VKTRRTMIDDFDDFDDIEWDDDELASFALIDL
jgi:hypothetical protein